MKSVRVATARGQLVGAEEWPGLLAELAHVVVDAEREGRVLGGPLERAGRHLWLKGDHLPGSARWRYSLRRWLGGPLPREREARNLAWLREHLFRAPRPLASAVLVRAGIARYQVLVLAPLPEHRPLPDAWRDGTAAERARWSTELACEVARLHALHFVHRDLFLRNVVVGREPGSSDARELCFLDAWHAPYARPGRDVAYDLGCLLLDAVSLFTAEELAAWLSLYASERAAQGAPVELRRLLPEAARHRRALVARRNARAGAPVPVEWDFRPFLPR